MVVMSDPADPDKTSWLTIGVPGFLQGTDGACRLQDSSSGTEVSPLEGENARAIYARWCYYWEEENTIFRRHLMDDLYLKLSPSGSH